MKAVVVCCFLLVWISLVSVPFGGLGTSTDPYIITSITDLQWVSDNQAYWNSYYIQANDIDAAITSTWDGGNGFLPIGYIDNETTDEYPFTGNYDGQNHVIDGLFINRRYTESGLFGVVDGCTITNLGLTNVDIVGGYYTGAIVGHGASVNMSQCYSTGAINARSRTGGLIGTCYSSNISNCYTTVEVTCTGYTAGGFIGRCASTTINKCYSTGSVTAVSDDYGFIGYQYGNSITNCFWDTETSGQSTTSGNAVGKTTAEMQAIATYTDVSTAGLNSAWDFYNNPNDDGANADYWIIDTDYPLLIWQQKTPIVLTTDINSITPFTATGYGSIYYSGWDDSVINYGMCWSLQANPSVADFNSTVNGSTTDFCIDITNLSPSTTYYCKAFAANGEGVAYGEVVEVTTKAVPTFNGSGTDIDPYQISTIEDLLWISENPFYYDRYYIQTNDIDATITSTWYNGDGFPPIGYEDTVLSTIFSFTGNYNGDKYSIDGLHINSNADVIGLFGYLAGATVTNLSLTNVNIAGNNIVGALFGYASASSISKCSSSGVVSSGTCAGGLGGTTENSNISNCYTVANVTVSSSIGGGLLGEAENTIITDSFAAGTVTGTDIAGIAYQQVANTITNTFWDTETSGISVAVGGETGKTTNQMQEVSTFTDLNTIGLSTPWDFVNNPYDDTNNNDVWIINNSYPMFTWQHPLPIVSTGSHESITYNSANVEGLLIYDGYEPDQFRNGFCYSTHSNPTLNDYYSDNDSPLGVYQHTLTNLDSETTYYYRAYARNSNGIVYGEVRSFTTEIEIILTGSGTQASPYQITSIDDLAWVEAHESFWGFHYVQMNDIDASITSSWNSGDGYIPIGYIDDETTDEYPFTGSYDGQNHVIDGLFINRRYTESGLFGVVDGCTITNLGLTNVDIVGGYYTGAIVGHGASVNMSQCYSTGAINARSRTGGLIGTCYSSNISNCYTTVEVTCTGYTAGGFIGRCASTTINKCYSTGSVTAVSDDYGFIGYQYGNSITNCFWDTETSGQSTTSGNAVGKTTAEMQAIATYTDVSTVGLNSAWDFVDNPNDDTVTQDIWNMNLFTNSGYPIMSWQEVLPNPDETSSTDNLFPYDLDEDLPRQVTLSWQYKGDVIPDGFRVFVSDEQVGNVINWVGDEIYNLALPQLNWGATINWKVVPFKSNTECPDPQVSSFTVMNEPAENEIVPEEVVFYLLEDVSGTNPPLITLPPIDLGEGDFTPSFNMQFGVELSNEFLEFIVRDQPFETLPNPSACRAEFYLDIPNDILATIVFRFSDTAAASELVHWNGSGWQDITESSGADFSIPGQVTFDWTSTGRGKDSFVINSGESSTLPITLTSFYAVQIGENNSRIMWEVASEVDIIGYNLLRVEGSGAQNGTIRVNPSIIEGHLSGTGFNYSYLDESLNKGQLYTYWLESVCLDGAVNLYGPCSLTILDEDDEDIPEELCVTGMKSIYPNPFNPSTCISFSLAEDGDVELSVYDVKGHLVSRVEEQRFEEGDHVINWYGLNNVGKRVASGIYLFKLRVQNETFVRKAMMIK